MHHCSMSHIIGKQHIGNAVFMQIIDNIQRKITAINDMYLLKGIEQIRRQCIAIAVLEYRKPTTVVGLCLDAGKLVVTPHESAIGSHPLGIYEEITGNLIANRYDPLARSVKAIIDIIGLHRCVARCVIYKSLGCFFQPTVRGKSVHRADKTGNFMRVKPIKLSKRDHCRKSELPGCIIGSKRSPMMVSAKIGKCQREPPAYQVPEKCALSPYTDPVYAPRLPPDNRMRPV